MTTRILRSALLPYPAAVLYGLVNDVARYPEFLPWCSATEVLEVSGAFLQLYREEGWYLERTVHYVARVGLQHVKQKVLEDAANRQALWARLQDALAGEPDPWFEGERARVDARQFIPIVPMAT